MIYKNKQLVLRKHLEWKIASDNLWKNQEKHIIIIKATASQRESLMMLYNFQKEEKEN